MLRNNDRLIFTAWKKRWYERWLKVEIAFCVPRKSCEFDETRKWIITIFGFGVNYPFKCGFSLYEQMSSDPCIAYHTHGGTPSMFCHFQELGERVRFLRYEVCHVTLMHCSKTLFLADRRDKTIDWNVSSRYISQLAWTNKTADLTRIVPHRLQKISLHF